MGDEVIPRQGLTYVCEVPNGFGAVIKLEVKRGRVVARTESGQTMILPVNVPGQGAS